MKFTEKALKLLWRYGQPCYFTLRMEEDKSIITYENVNEENIKDVAPEAYALITTLAERYGVKEINELLVHAYFFTDHNEDHEEDGHFFHKAYVGVVEEIFPHKVRVLLYPEKKEKLDVVNYYNLPLNKGMDVIIHARFIVTNEVPDVVKRLSHVKDIRAWEPYIRGR